MSQGTLCHMTMPRGQTVPSQNCPQLHLQLGFSQMCEEHLGRDEMGGFGNPQEGCTHLLLGSLPHPTEATWAGQEEQGPPRRSAEGAQGRGGLI